MGKLLPGHLPLDVIREIFVPDYEAGTVVYAERPRSQFDSDRGFNNYNSNWVGREALTVQVRGRCSGRITVNGIRYGLSRARVIWALYHGEWPKAEVGHRNGIVSDDRIVNLREQTRSDTMITRRAVNKTGVVGVYQLPNGRFYACVRNRGQYFYVGSFDTLEQARAAREEAALKIQGEFARVTAATNCAGGARS
ncbi:HNH endonuclease [Devosia marina]|uniref:AP2/ERF domain-containing protein n=1 Tax=Devosia marina TaxID=2683198 RepID=A0A7X3K213_9HYPH|nr:HNH endonuclease [Devosia marina]MVS97897.1 hypothetical protein [Devosia marina]